MVCGKLDESLSFYGYLVWLTLDIFHYFVIPEGSQEVYLYQAGKRGILLYNCIAEL